MSMEEFNELVDEEFEFPNPKTEHERRSNEALERLRNASGFVNVVKAREEYRKRLMIATYKDVQNPKRLDLDELEEIVLLSAENATERKYLGRVRSPLTVIRAYCVRCVDGVANVRNCSTVNCPLWPFRMGNNPFYGTSQDADAEVTESEEYQGEEPGIVIPYEISNPETEPR